MQFQELGNGRIRIWHGRYNNSIVSCCFLLFHIQESPPINSLKTLKNVSKWRSIPLQLLQIVANYGWHISLIFKKYSESSFSFTGVSLALRKIKINAISVLSFLCFLLLPKSLFLTVLLPSGKVRTGLFYRRKNWHWKGETLIPVSQSFIWRCRTRNPICQSLVL